MVKVTAIIGSPKHLGNTEKLKDCFLKGAESAGAEITKVMLKKLKYKSCMGCNKCHETGRCVMKDDLTQVFEDIVTGCDILVLSSPIYSMTVTAEMKGFIDRGQYLWARRFRTNETEYSEEHLKTHIGVFISTAGMDMPTVFDSAYPTVRALFNDAGFTYSENITAAAMDKYGGIGGRPDIMNAAEELGKKLCLSGDLRRP
ncbi:MAG: flavodoxin family protein [Methanomicrobium sp.]|nr:flavodoxin family protein [Methanomicrobium sp.]